MATKAEELKLMAEGKGCLGKAADDEPIFILRAQDILAPEIIRAWAARAMLGGASKEKTNEALQLADKMATWPHRKNPD